MNHSWRFEMQFLGFWRGMTLWLWDFTARAISTLINFWLKWIFDSFGWQKSYVGNLEKQDMLIFASGPIKVGCDSTRWNWLNNPISNNEEEISPSIDWCLKLEQNCE